jgi:hypothetical protein
MATSAADAKQNAPSNLPLFYKNPAPLEAEKHAKMGLKPNFGLAFTQNVNAVPINMIEMAQVCHYYPIAFSPDAHATPVAIMGLRDSENLFLNSAGEWLADTYIPAYIRRYPFIFSEVPGTDQLTLCADMDPQFINDNAEQKFFETDGKPTQLAQNALEFCKSYHAAAQQTLAFSKALVENDLLIDRAAEINIGNGKQIKFSGFRIIDETKLANLSNEKFLEFRKNGWLPFIYAHLFSGGQWQHLVRLLQARVGN